ncbi:hypothetical protein ACRALDRAFT_209988 [Sodiomyces alcalophilus JCM 7366]|uniref:uncharacterized protein n=1 Tax=Sodiomyces alcalophilus JCM 7366 TaxID=591952 RepID=UPI0039B3F3FA
MAFQIASQLRSSFTWVSVPAIFTHLPSCYTGFMFVHPTARILLLLLLLNSLLARFWPRNQPLILQDAERYPNSRRELRILHQTTYFSIEMNLTSCFVFFIHIPLAGAYSYHLIPIFLYTFFAQALDYAPGILHMRLQPWSLVFTATSSAHLLLSWDLNFYLPLATYLGRHVAAPHTTSSLESSI